MDINKAMAAVKLAVDNFSNFSGRANREEYWYFIIPVLIIMVVLSIICSFLGTVGAIISGVCGLAVLVPAVSAAVRRLHDLGKPTIWVVMMFIPLANFYLLYLFTQLGDFGNNEFGKPSTNLQ
jgi:Predicted membrane protein